MRSGLNLQMLVYRPLFIDRGEDAMDEIREINFRLREVEAEIAKDFPLTDVAGFRAQLRAHVLEICAIEEQAISLLQTSMT